MLVSPAVDVEMNLQLRILSVQFLTSVPQDYTGQDPIFNDSAFIIGVLITLISTGQKSRTHQPCYRRCFGRARKCIGEVLTLGVIFKSCIVVRDTCLRLHLPVLQLLQSIALSINQYMRIVPGPTVETITTVEAEVHHHCVCVCMYQIHTPLKHGPACPRSQL